MTNTNEDFDPVNKPKHYMSDFGIQCIDVVENFDFCTGNVIKYLWRAGKKDQSPRLQDLKKAQFYLNRLIAKEEQKSTM